jgi:hypothetical protein
MKYHTVHTVRNASCLAVWVTEADGQDGGVYTAISSVRVQSKGRKSTLLGKTESLIRKVAPPTNEQPKAP